MTTTELFKKHFGDTGVANLKHPNAESFFEELNAICLQEDRQKNIANAPVIKSFIAVCGNEYFEDEDTLAGETVAVMGFEREKAKLLTEDEVKHICSIYPECKAMNV